MAGLRKYRLAVVGAQGVGKSTLLEQALAGVQSNRDLPLQRKRTEKATHFTFSFGWPGDAVELAVIDTPGQLGSFREMRTVSGIAFETEFDLVLCTYSIDSLESLQALPEYIQGIRSLISNSPPMMLLGLKSDLNGQRMVSKEEAERFAREHGLYQHDYIREVSAKRGSMMIVWARVAAMRCKAFRTEQEQRHRRETESRRRDADTQTDGPVESRTTAAVEEEEELPPPTDFDGLVVDQIQCCSLM